MYHPTDPNSKQLMAPSGASNLPGPQRVVYLEPYETPSASVDSPSGLFDFFQLLRARKWLLLLFALGGVGLAGLISLRQTPLFLARTTLELHEGGQQLLGTMRDMAAGEGRITPEAYLSTQVKVLQSLSLVRRVEHRLRSGASTPDGSGLLPPIPPVPGAAKLEPTPGPVPPAGAAMASNNPLGIPGSEAKDRTANGGPKVWEGKLPGVKTEIRTFGAARILEILCESPDPHYAADFANGMAEEYIQSSMEARWGVAQRTSTWLNRQ
ncbi:MAG: hypothetical protein R2762_11695 [Bryobacteraceae bacterium]